MTLNQQQVDEMWIRVKNIELYRKKGLVSKIDDIEYLKSVLKDFVSQKS